MPPFYILDGKTVVLCDNWETWGKWMQANSRRVALDAIDDVVISTVFLGLDHSHGFGPSLFFETLVFVGEESETGQMNRYETWNEALAGHKVIVEEVRAYQEGADDHAVSLLGHLRAIYAKE